MTEVESTQIAAGSSTSLAGVLNLLPTFEEKNEQLTASNFITACEQVFEITNLTSQQKILAVRSRLRGKAASLALSVRVLKEINDFNIFKKNFIDYFDKKDPKPLMLQKLMNCTQRVEESVRDFADRLETCVQKYAEENNADEIYADIKFQIFINGLNFNLKAMILPLAPSNYDEALKMALRCEETKLLLQPTNLNAHIQETIPNMSQINQLSRQVTQLEQKFNDMNFQPTSDENKQFEMRNKFYKKQQNLIKPNNNYNLYRPRYLPNYRPNYPSFRSQSNFGFRNYRFNNNFGGQANPLANFGETYPKRTQYFCSACKGNTCFNFKCKQNQGQNITHSPFKRFQFGGTSQSYERKSENNACNTFVDRGRGRRQYRMGFPVNNFKIKQGNFKPRVNKKQSKNMGRNSISTITNNNNSLPILRLKINGVILKLLLDTGSQISLITKDKFYKLPNNNKLQKLKTTHALQTMNGKILDVQGSYNLTLELENEKILHTFVVIDSPVKKNFDGILGYDFLSNYNAVIDLENFHVKIRNYCYQLESQPPNYNSCANYNVIINTINNKRKIYQKYKDNGRYSNKKTQLQTRNVNQKNKLSMDLSKNKKYNKLINYKNNIRNNLVSRYTNYDNTTATKDFIKCNDNEIKQAEQNSEMDLPFLNKLKLNEDYINFVSKLKLDSKLWLEPLQTKTINVNIDDFKEFEKSQFLINPSVKFINKGLTIKYNADKINNKKIPLTITNKDKERKCLNKHMFIASIERIENTFYEKLPKIEKVNPLSIKDFDLNEVPNEIKIDLEKLLLQYKDVFARNLRELQGSCKLPKFKIELIHPELKCNRRPYPIPLALRQQYSEIIQEMVDCNILEPSLSEYSCPAFLLKQPGVNKAPRLIADFRALNDITKTVHYQSMPMNEILDSIPYDSKFFCSLDLFKGYFQIEVEENSQKYLTIGTGIQGSYSFKKLPLGVKNAVAHFSSCMNIVLTELKKKFTIFYYLDDVLLISKSVNEGLEGLKQLFETLRIYNLKINPTKCKFFQTKIEFLGHVVSSEGIVPSKKNISAVLNLKPPKTRKQIRQILGAFGFVKSHIPHYAEIATPITNLLKKSEKKSIVWSNECDIAFQKLKQLIVNPPILARYNPRYRLLLATDASNYACGAALFQITEKDEKQIIGYYSKKFTDAQKKYSIFELELLAVVLAVNNFKHYLSHNEFLLQTDCKNLLSLLKLKDNCARILRWKLILSEFNFIPFHVKGSENSLADLLSRGVNFSENNNLSLEERLEYALNKTDYVDNKNNCDINNIDSLVVEENCKEFFTMFPNKFSVNKLKSEQNKDEDLKKIINIIKEDVFTLDLSKYAYYYLDSQGILRIRDKTEIGKIVVPTSLQKKLIEVVHEQCLVHAGLKATTELLCQFFIFSNMVSKIRKQVLNCVTCIQYKRYPTTKTNFLPQLSPPQTINEQWSVDLVGPFCTSKNNKKYILTQLDTFSNLVNLIAIENCDSENCLNALMEIIKIHGLPKSIVTDNARYFSSHEFTNTLKELNIKQIFTSPYHPQSNRVERLHKDMNKKLAVLLKGNKNNWHLTLPIIQLSLNTMTNRSTKYSPFFLHYGFNPNLPMSSLLNEKEFVSNNTTLHTAQNLHRSEILKNFVEIWPKMEENKKKAREERDKLREKVSTKNVKFKKGDKVFLYLPERVQGQMRKFGCHSFGPYIIKSFTTPVNVQLIDMQNPCRLVKAHIDKLIKYEDQTSSDSEEEEDVEFELKCNPKNREIFENIIDEELDWEINEEENNANNDQVVEDIQQVRVQIPWDRLVPKRGENSGYNLRQVVREPNRYGSPTVITEEEVDEVEELEIQPSTSSAMPEQQVNATSSEPIENKEFIKNLVTKSCPNNPTFIDKITDLIANKFVNAVMEH